MLTSTAKSLSAWWVKVRKMKAVFHALNLFSVDVTNKCLVGECWTPSADLEAVRSALHAGMERSGSTVAPVVNRMDAGGLVPPTFFRTNRFTNAFQVIGSTMGECLITL